MNQANAIHRFWEVKSRMCIKCNIFTDNAFVLEVANAYAFVSFLHDMDVPYLRAIELTDRAYPCEYDDYVAIQTGHTFVLPLCSKCATKWSRGETIDVYRRRALYEASLNEEPLSIVCYRRRSLDDAQAGWDNTQKKLSEPVYDTVKRGTVEGTGRSLVTSLDKDIRKLVTPAVKAGWEPSMDGKGHIRFTKDGESFTAPSTPSTNRVLDNLRTQMRSVGAIW